MFELPGRYARTARRRLLRCALAAAVVCTPLAVLPRDVSAAPAAAAASAYPSRPSLARDHFDPSPRARSIDWTSSNGNLENTRAAANTAIDAADVAHLSKTWDFPLTGPGTFAGLLVAAPLVVGGTIYLINVDSDVFAIDRATGTLIWKHDFNSPTPGPNGLAYAGGRLFGTTEDSTFALDSRSGSLVWSRTLVQNGLGGIDVAPQVVGRNVIVSTVPTTFTSYPGGAMGIIYALDMRTGAISWEFNTVKDGYLWGNAAVNSGGGTWYPPAADSAGRVFFGTGNPAPIAGTKEYPNGSSRPGANLYTDSLVALDSRTGKLVWYHQVVSHDLRDYDFQDPPIVSYAKIDGVRTEVVVGAGKSGQVIAFRAGDGKRLWTVSVGKHENDSGPLPDTPISVYPGVLGGVETPMALSGGLLFVPWVNDPSTFTSSSFTYPDTSIATGGITAIQLATGRVVWQRTFPQMDIGSATVANDVLFTGTVDGTEYALNTKTGRTLWTAQLPAGTNSPPAIVGNSILIGAGSPGTGATATPELVEYSLSDCQARHHPGHGNGLGYSA